MKAKIKSNRIVLIFGLFLIATVFGLALFSLVKADDNSDCDDQIFAKCVGLTEDEYDKCQKQEKAKCKILEKKADTYEDIIDIKNKQENNLIKQMALIDAQQQKNKEQIQETQTAAEQLVDQISNLEREISYKENLIKYQQIILAGLLQNFYEDYQDGVLKIVLIKQDFSDLLNRPDYIEQTSAKVSEALGIIRESKNELQREYDEIKRKKKEREDLKQHLQEQQTELQSTEIQKKALLAQTQGEEQKYQKLLSRVEQEKLQLFNFSEADNLDDVNASISKYSSPKDHLASTSWYFSQKDPRWGNKTIGNSCSFMKDYGCAVTSVAMVFKFYGAKIDPGSLAKQKIFYYDLIRWPASWSPSIELTSSISHGNINWKTINSEINKDHPVIVYIKKTNGGGGHYVVVHNKDSRDYIVHDPYFGSNIYLGTSRSLLGALGKNSGTVVDQMIIYR